MSQKFDLFFHLGFPKVASTFLQKEIFPKLSNIQYHRKRKFNEYMELDADRLTSNHLFSCEFDRELEIKVDEITAMWPDAKVLLFVRRQDKWLLSKYKYYIRKHGYVDFKEYFDIDANNGLLKREELFFEKKIKYIENRCKVKPLVLPHDLLKTNADLFFQLINQYMDTSLSSDAKTGRVINKAFSEKQLICLRKFNQIYRYRKINTPFKIVNKVHYKYRQFLLHIVAFLFRFIPSVFVSQKSLVSDANLLSQIREYYKRDWEYCRGYSEDYSRSIIDANRS